MTTKTPGVIIHTPVKNDGVIIGLATIGLDGDISIQITHDRASELLKESLLSNRADSISLMPNLAHAYPASTDKE